MKNFLKCIISFLFVYIFISCSETAPTEDKFTAYNGKWLLLQTVGGFAPTVFRPQNGSIIKISYDKLSKFEIYRNDSIKVIANYYLGKAEHNIGYNGIMG